MTDFPSALIRFERLRRGWSQEGLCRGVCAVSYLSKIEQGKAQPGEDVVAALMRRLELEWHGGAEAQAARALLDEMLDAFLSMEEGTMARLWETYAQRRSACLYGPHMADALMLEALYGHAAPGDEQRLAAMEGGLNQRQRALWLMAQQRYDEACALMPVSYAFLQSGYQAYFAGRYSQAAERLKRAGDLAAEEGRARVLMLARAYLGNCASNQGEYQVMCEHYQAARRLGLALGDEEVAEVIAYNTAATQIQLGMYEPAVRYLEALEQPDGLALHKLAVCQEKLGSPERALKTLERLFALPGDDEQLRWAQRMGRIVRRRLTQPDYLHDPAYGQMLLGAYEEMKRECPSGFALFHRPWVEQWYVANRQYKQAYELYKKTDFPVNC